jgi:energy-converting hydrogenase Eha subunit E
MAWTIIVAIIYEHIEILIVFAYTALLALITYIAIRRDN